MPKKDKSAKPENVLQSKKEPCAFCLEPADLKCTGCRNVYYCNKEHQKFHWKTHVNDCRGLKLVDDSDGNRYYVATRDIKVGELMHKEKEPLVMGPSVQTTLFPTCLNCYVYLKNETDAKPCEKCGWPLCRDCKNHGPECAFTSGFLRSKIHVTEFGKASDIYNTILIIRALALRTSNPAAYDKLLKLRNCRRATCDFIESWDFTNVAKFFELVNAKQPNSDRTIEDEVAKLQPILRVFSHNIEINSHQLVAVYDKVSYFKHDCASNCAKTITDHGGIVIRAIRPISKGDYITICYVDPCLHNMRRDFRLSNQFICCNCERCNDPTEFGTMYNSIKCIKNNCDGHMLPSSFKMKNFRWYPDFVCDKCSARKSYAKVAEMNEIYNSELEKLGDTDDLAKLKAFMEKQKEKFHENHCFVVAIKLKLAIAIRDKSVARISNALLKENIKYLKDSVKLIKQLRLPDKNLLGRLLYDLYNSVSELGMRNIHDIRLAHSIMKECYELCCETYELLRHEPENSREFEIATNTKKAMIEIKPCLELRTLEA